jgi:hypothetical protein
MNSRRLIDDRSHPATRCAYATRPGARNPDVVLAASVRISGRAYQVAALHISSGHGQSCRATNGTEREDLGADHFDRRSTEIKARRLAAQIKKLGFEVGIRPLPQAA